MVRKHAGKTLLENLENRVIKFINEQFTTYLKSQDQTIAIEAAKIFQRRISDLNRAKRKTKSGKPALGNDNRLHEQQVNHVLFSIDSLTQVIE